MASPQTAQIRPATSTCANSWCVAQTVYEELPDSSPDQALVIGDRVVLVPGDEYDAIEDSVALTGDNTFMAAFHAGVSEIAAGKGIPWDQVKAELGL